MDANFLLTSHADRPRLRVGLLMNGIVAPRWVSETIEQLLGCNFVTIALVVTNGAAKAPISPSSPRAPLIRRLVRLLASPDRLRKLLFELYQRWDARNVDSQTDPLALVDCSELLFGVRTIQVNPVTSRFVHRFEDKDLDTIRGEELDVVIRFGFNILRGEILQAARYGVWSYHHGDNEFYRGGPAYFWEVVEGNPCSGAILQLLSERLDDGQILCKGVFASEPGLSQARNRVRPYWGAVTFLVQKLRELHLYGWEYVEARIEPSATYRGRKTIYRTPGNLEMLRWLVPQGARAVLRRLRRGRRTLHWRLGVRVTDAPLVEGGSHAGSREFHWIDSPRGHYYADPFVANAFGRRWVFFEDFDYKSQIGTIRVAELHGRELVGDREALRRPYHLSYPCVFQDGDDWYMIPETADSGGVELYAAQRFPDEWTFVRTLLKGLAVDSTIWHDGKRYWLFVTRVEPRGNAWQLWLYTAGSLMEEWKPHPSNPISTDVRYSRGGGAVFRHKGRLFRPSQDGTIRYGRRIILNEIQELAPNAYRERVAVEFGPEKGDPMVGFHTYVLSGALEIIDGQQELDIDKV